MVSADSRRRSRCRCLRLDGSSNRALSAPPQPESLVPIVWADWEDDDISTFFGGTVVAERRGKTGTPIDPRSPNSNLLHLDEVGGFLHMDVSERDPEGKDRTRRTLCKPSRRRSSH